MLLQNAQLDKVEGLGTGKLREHFDAIVKAGGRFYLSGISSRARGVTEADILGKPAEFAMPTKLVQLATESNRMFTYLEFTYFLQQKDATCCVSTQSKIMKTLKC